METQELSVQELQTRIEKALASAVGLKPPRVVAEVRGTRVTLTGEVSTWAQHEAAERAALATPGVTMVDNQVSLVVHGRRARQN